MKAFLEEIIQDSERSENLSPGKQIGNVIRLIFQDIHDPKTPVLHGIEGTVTDLRTGIVSSAKPSKRELQLLFYANFPQEYTLKFDQIDEKL